MNFFKRLLGGGSQPPQRSPQQTQLPAEAKCPQAHSVTPGEQLTLSKSTSAEATVKRERVLGDVQRAMDEQDVVQRANICQTLVGLGPACREHLLDIVLDKSLNFVTRRYALKIASGFRDETSFRFIRSNCIAGKNKGQLSRALGDDEESHAQMALFVTGEEILNTPDFFQRYVAKVSR